MIASRIRLHAFVDGFKDEDNPEGVNLALEELRRRGFVIPYLTIHRWLSRQSRPLTVYCRALEAVGVDAWYLRTAPTKHGRQEKAGKEQE